MCWCGVRLGAVCAVWCAECGVVFVMVWCVMYCSDLININTTVLIAFMIIIYLICSSLFGVECWVWI